MNLLIDMDETLCDLLTPFLEIYNKRCNDDLTKEDVVVYGLDNIVKPDCKHVIGEVFNTPGFFFNLKPYPNAINILERLNIEHDIYIVTLPPSGVAFEEKRQWVKYYLPFLADKMIFTGQKHVINGVLFDDNPIILKNFPGDTLAMDKPYNRHIKTNFRVKNWLEFENLINNYNKHWMTHFRREREVEMGLRPEFKIGQCEDDGYQD